MNFLFFKSFFWKIKFSKYLKKFNNNTNTNTNTNTNNKITSDDVFIVTSCTNPSDNKYYKNYNYFYNSNARFVELLKTFESIKKFYPDSYIVNLENSKIPFKYYSKIKKKTDKYYNFHNDSFIKLSRKHNNKGIPWLAKLIKYLSENNQSINHKRLHFLVGRYVLSKPKKKMFPGVYFRFYKNCNNVSTRYFYYNFVSPKIILSSLIKTFEKSLSGYSVEDFIHKFQTTKIFFVKKIGIKGLVNGIDKISE
jgi:hypothetical protein